MSKKSKLWVARFGNWFYLFRKEPTVWSCPDDTEGQCCLRAEDRHYYSFGDEFSARCWTTSLPPLHALCIDEAVRYFGSIKNYPETVPVRVSLEVTVCS